MVLCDIQKPILVFLESYHTKNLICGKIIHYLMKSEPAEKEEDSSTRTKKLIEKQKEQLEKLKKTVYDALERSNLLEV